MVENILMEFRKAIEKVKIGEGNHCHNLTLFPLFVDNGKEPPYILLGKAIEEGIATVEEMSESGSVPTLKIHNKGKKPILIMEGEILIGAKQNRVVNISIMIPAQCTFEIPVSCVERGRWSYRSRKFHSQYQAHPGLRSKKLRSALQAKAYTGRAQSDQMEVWEDVQNVAFCLDVHSTTESFTDSYEMKKDEIDEIRKQFTLPEGACGLMVCRGQQVIGMDLFDSHQTLKQLWDRLSNSYFIEGLIEKKDHPKTQESDARIFLNRLSDYAQISKSPPQLGIEIEIKGRDVIGSALWYNDSIRHLSAFTLLDKEINEI